MTPARAATPRWPRLAALALAGAAVPSCHGLPAPFPRAYDSVPWTRACTNVVRAGNTLTATCPDYFGHPVPSSIDESHCASIDNATVQNVNGSLRCVVSQTTPWTGVGNATAALDVVSVAPDTTNDKGHVVRHYRIDQPNVAVSGVAYPAVKLERGACVKFTPSGCVQTGGLGATWKDYTEPQAFNTDYYRGTAWIESVLPSPRSLEGLKCAPTYVPADLPADADLSLHLGYDDDHYQDNGYGAHDDGTWGQCRGKGPAAVELDVELGCTPVSPPPECQLPFDLVWATEDLNGLPLNPKWRWQEQHPGKVPDFKAVCAKAFPGPPCLEVFKPRLLAEVCTSQAPTTDTFTATVICPADPFRGHLDWSIATHVGYVAWDEYSGGWPNDDDCNLSLFPPDRAALTSANDVKIGVEFKASETVGASGSPFWTKLRTAIQRSDKTAASALFGGPTGKLSVVIGLLGLDGVHGAYTESHPAFAVAVQDSSTYEAATQTVVETWAFFVRNTGNEGGCSEQAHAWLSPLESGDYVVQLPWPNTATAVDLQPTDLQYWPWVSSEQATVAVERDEGPPNKWTVLRVSFGGSPDGGVDGMVNLRYSVTGKPTPPARGTAATATSAPEAPVLETEGSAYLQGLGTELAKPRGSAMAKEFVRSAPATKPATTVKALAAPRAGASAVPTFQRRNKPRTMTVVRPRSTTTPNATRLRKTERALVDQYIDK